MKNNKNNQKSVLRRNLTTALLVLVMFVTIMTLINNIVSWTYGQEPYFYKVVEDVDEYVIHLDWSYGGLCLIFIILALGVWLTRLIMCVIPQSKITPLSSHSIMCEVFIGLGMVLSLIGLMLPEGARVQIWFIETFENNENRRIIASTVLQWLSGPLSLVGVLLSYKNY